jgi:hypothetical protein
VGELLFGRIREKAKAAVEFAVEQFVLAAGGVKLEEGECGVGFVIEQASPGL